MIIMKWKSDIVTALVLIICKVILWITLPEQKQIVKVTELYIFHLTNTWLPFLTLGICDLALCLLVDECWDHSDTQRSAEDLFTSQVKEKSSLKKGPDLLKCVTVSKISKPWKLLIHHRLGSLAFSALTLGHKQHYRCITGAETE